MAISQQDRLVRITTPPGENTFIVLSFSGIEEISDLFDFHLELASERHNIAFGQLTGRDATVSIPSSGGGHRRFNGITVPFSPAEVSEKEGYSKHRAVMRPVFWTLVRCRDCRIFHDKSVPDTIRQDLYQASLGPKSVKATMDYCLQHKHRRLQPAAARDRSDRNPGGPGMPAGHEIQVHAHRDIGIMRESLIPVLLATSTMTVGSEVNRAFFTVCRMAFGVIITKMEI